MTDQELMQQALDALEDAGNGSQKKSSEPVITALHERLAQPEHDYRTRYERGCYKCGSHYCPANCPEPTHLALQQPQMQPCAGRNCGSTNPNLHSAECFEDYEKATGMSTAEHDIMTYPFSGEIKMNKVIKDGKEVIEWEEVDMSLHSAGNLGIGTQPAGNIYFFGTPADSHTEVLRISKDGIWANPDISMDEAAKLVLTAIDQNIKVLVDKAVNDKLDEIAKKIEAMPFGDTAASFAVWIREQRT